MIPSDTPTTRVMQTMIANCQTNKEVEKDLRRVLEVWVQETYTRCLPEIGELFLKQHIAEQRENAEMN